MIFPSLSLAALALLTVLGVFLHGQMLAVSAGVALTAAAAFDRSARRPGLRAALVALPVKSWRRAG